MARSFRIWLSLFAVLAFFAVTANAQLAGRLSGSVVDPTGASIPGATVNVFVPGGKEPIASTTTNEAGLFTFPAMRPETYQVSVEAKGFIKVTLVQVKVAPIQETGLAPIKMEVQSASQSVEVSANVQAVQLSNAEVTSTITATQVQNLPVLGRQVSALFQTQPGVTAGSNTTSVNGLRSSFSSVTLDGVNIQDNFIRTNSLDYMPMRPTIDQVAEITVSTSNGSAGLGGGTSQMVLSTKSGTNDFHGSVYWFNRNSALAANDWFNNRDGSDRNTVNLNQPGAGLGGRIIRDKLFFYTNYELYRNKRTDSYTRTVLTDSAKAGIVTYRTTAGVVQTASLASLRNFTADPTVKAMIGQLPAPNSPGGDGLNTSGYRFNARHNEFRDQFVIKSDYYLNAKHNITGTYNYISNPTDRPDLGTFYTTMPPVSNSIQNHLMSLAWRAVISPTMTNEARFGFLRAKGNFDVSNDYPKFQLSATNLLFSNPVNTYMNQGRQTNTYTIQDNANWLKGRHELAFGFQSQLIRTNPFNDAGILPTYTLGISSANTALQLTAADLPGINTANLTTANNLYANMAGIISSAAQTFNVTSTTSGFVPGATNLRQLTQNTYAFYAQDKWKIRPNLTLTLGLRYEYWTPLDEVNGLFLTPTFKGDLKSTLLDPNATLDFIGGPSGRKFYNADKNNFAPNIGFAWDPFKNGKTSVRGSFSVAYANDNVVTSVRNSVSTSSGLQFANTQTNLTSFLTNPTVVAAPAYKVPRTLQDNYAITRTSATGMPDANLATPYAQMWSVGIQHDYKGTIFSATYIGNRGRDLLRAIDYNQIQYNLNGFLADFKRAQSNASLAQAAGKAYLGTYDPSIAGSQQLTIFPLLASGGNLTSTTYQTYLKQGEVGELANQYMVNGQNNGINFFQNPYVQGANGTINGGSSTYHAIQLVATRRISSGLQAQFSYSFSKNLSNTAGDGQTNFEPLLDNNNLSLENARSPYDVNHVLKANYYYELPFGHGKRWSSNRLANYFIGGWALAGIWSYESGSPYSILSGRGTLNRAARSTATNTASVVGTTGETLKGLTTGVFKTADDIYFVSPTILGGDGRAASPAGVAPFSGQIFFNPDAGTVGDLQRRMFSGPWQWSWDASVIKSITFKERHHLDLHFDLFNYMNHPTFYIYPSQGDYGTQTPFNINNTTFGEITDMNYNPRVIQIGARYRF